MGRRISQRWALNSRFCRAMKMSRLINTSGPPAPPLPPPTALPDGLPAPSSFFCSPLRPRVAFFGSTDPTAVGETSKEKCPSRRDGSPGPRDCARSYTFWSRIIKLRGWGINDLLGG